MPQLFRHKENSYMFFFTLHYFISNILSSIFPLQLGHCSLEACLNFQEYWGLGVTGVTMCWLCKSDINSKYRGGENTFPFFSTIFRC